MVAKVIAYGDTRDQAIRRMRIALSEMSIEGIKTNIALHQELMLDAGFIKGGMNIHYPVSYTHLDVYKRQGKDAGDVSMAGKNAGG